ncbi:NUDIX hydrolase [Streptomyces sp. NRRL S-1022]|uniref:NUDIX hydrolase n=1 Tax=Streptomyces sp. NRRL S-1022 TaxID=1463880 RepID=UPI0004BE4E81|nr:NUDIX domain-containing protein [Streptomyces sp. NRRL S-1022]
MTLEQAGNVVRAVVVYDGRVLLVPDGDGWGLPAGTPEPAETAQATAARIVYEATGYLVDGTEPLEPGEAAGETAVVCQLLSESPSSGGRLAPDQLRWTPIEETTGTPLPAPVRTYLQGHTPV